MRKAKYYCSRTSNWLHLRCQDFSFQRVLQKGKANLHCWAGCAKQLKRSQCAIQLSDKCRCSEACIVAWEYMLARAMSINKYYSFRYGGLFVLGKASINPKVQNWKKHGVALLHRSFVVICCAGNFMHSFWNHWEGVGWCFFAWTKSVSRTDHLWYRLFESFWDTFRVAKQQSFQSAPNVSQWLTVFAVSVIVFATLVGTQTWGVNIFFPF